MPKYKIFETDQFQSDFKNLPKKYHQLIEDKIYNYVYKQISENPFYGLNIKKLKAYKPDTWRYRIGNYRLFYEVDDKQKIIFILSIDHRKNVY